jgi:hypothetical protein
MRAALSPISSESRGEVARAGRLAMRGDEATIGVLRFSRCDALRDDAARRILAEMIILVPESTC